MPGSQAFRAIIFDMDGVLMHSSPIHEAAYRQALAAVPGASFAYESVAGMRTDEAMRCIFAANGLPASDAEIAALSAEKSRLARAWIAHRNPIDPDARMVLEALHGRYPLALASSASKPTVELFLDANRLRPMFASVLDGNDVHAAKPAPDIYRLASARLNVSPSDCLIVEDAITGIEAAKKAGAAVWAVPTTCSPERLAAAGADRILERLGDLRCLVEAC